ncbi:MAG: winged helix-turn-helix domain-containing protein [Gaiellaceae bacterium]
MEDTIRQASCIQLDSISTVERSHRLAIASRVGDYGPGTVPRLLAQGRVIEYWAHEACLLPAEDWPLFGWVRENFRNHHPWHGDVKARYPGLADEILGQIRERGAVGSRDFDGQGSGTMWNWKPAKVMLEALFSAGELVIAGRVSGFQRLYDLPERVLPREVLETRVQSEEDAVRELVVRAVRARGPLTESAIAEHWRLKGRGARVRPVVDGLVAAGRLERLRVNDGGGPVVVEAGADLDPPRPTAAVLLSPFDNLLWDRPFARRALGFDHVIEVYKPAPQRTYGYYVLPFLWRDRIVGRVDLKSERKDGALVVKAFHLEPGLRRSAALEDAFDRALDKLRRVTGLERVVR